MPLVDRPALEAAAKLILRAIGEDIEREGLKDTPRRFADSWKEFMEYSAGTTDTCFHSVCTDQMVVV